MKTGKLTSKLKTSVLYSLCWKLPDRTQSFVFCSQIVAAEYINAMFLLVSKFKMTDTLLNVTYGQVQKRY